MDIIVKPLRTAPTRGELICGDLTFDCVLGRAGVSARKREGDGATPVGTFALRQAFYRAERVAVPFTRLPLRAIRRQDGWCDDPHARAYNTLVKLPIKASAETLWRDDHVYDVVVVIGYNDDPVVPGKGSAIFMHATAPQRTPTAGCVALELPDLLRVLARLDANSTVTIRRPAR